MGLIESLAGRLFKGYFTKYESDLRKSIGSEVYKEILKTVNNRPVYPPDNVESYINNGYLFNPLVYSIVSFIAQKAGSIPWAIYRVKDEKALHSYKSANKYDLNTKIVKTKALVQLPDHELNQLFITPNILQGWAEFFEQVVGFKLITGNSYIHCIGPTSGLNAGLVKEMWSLPSQIIKPVAGDQITPIRGYQYLTNGVMIPKEQVIHLKYWTPEYFNGQNLYGLSPIRAAHRTIAKSNASIDSSTASFQNMGAVGILTPEAAAGEVNPLTPEQQEMIEQTFKKKTGPKHRGSPIIGSIPLKWQQIGMSPVDLNIIESDKWDLRTLCNVFHIGSELMGDAANKTYSNMKEAGSAAYTNAILPQCNQFRDSFNMQIQAKYGKEIYADYDASMISELQDDLSLMAGALSTVWFLTPNEKRDILNFPADETNPVMDDYFVPMGLMPLSKSLEEPTPDEAIDEAEKRFDFNDYK